MSPVFVVMRPAQHAARAKPFRLETRHAGFDAKLFGQPVGRDDDAVAAPAAADPDGAALQLIVERDFATGKKTVAIHMQNPVVLVRSKQMKLIRRPPPRHSGLFTTANDAKILPQRLGQRLSNRKSKKTARNEFPRRSCFKFRLGQNNLVAVFQRDDGLLPVRCLAGLRRCACGGLCRGRSAC